MNKQFLTLPTLLFLLLTLISGPLAAESFSGTAERAVQDADITTPTLLAGKASLRGTTSATASLIAAAASGGKGQYAYQWYCSTRSRTLGSAVAGATSLTLTQSGLSASTTHYYTLRVTDRAGKASTADSNQVTARTLASPTKQVVFDGDSLTYGLYASTNPGGVTGTSYPAYATTFLGTEWATAQYGVGGQTLIDMESDAATQIDATRDSSKMVTILCAQGGTNDLKLGASAATTYYRFLTYGQSRRAAGWKVVAITIPYADSPGLLGSSFNADVDTVNANIRAHWHDFADALADVNADMRLRNPDDSTYFQPDHIHFTDLGNSVYATIVTAVMQNIVSPGGGGMPTVLFHRKLH